MKTTLTAITLFFFKPVPIWTYWMGLIAGIGTWLFGDLSTGMAFLFSFSALDLISGMLKYWIKKEFNYRKINKTVYKILGYTVFVVLLRVIFSLFLPSVPGLTPGTMLISSEFLAIMGVIPHLLIAMLSFKEISSNIDNLTDAGIIPQSVGNSIRGLMNRLTKKAADTIADGDL